MVVGSAVAILRKELEQRFPGKWLLKNDSPRKLKTGFAPIDDLFVSGLLRRRIIEWSGATSSGKTAILRSICTNWCESGLNVIYVDCYDRLHASDWCNLNSRKNGEHFWVLRGGKSVAKNNFFKESLWACEQLIRSQMFDVVILDVAAENIFSNSFYRRLQQAVECSTAALIVLKDNASSSIAGASISNSGNTPKFEFFLDEPLFFEYGGGADVISVHPTIRGVISRDGACKNLEVSTVSNVSNCLFTHPKIPDRRSPKGRTATTS